MPARLALLLAALVVLPACGLGGPDPIGVTGTWEGEVYDPDVVDAPRYPIELRLRDTGLRITGTGVVDLPGERFAFAVTDGSFLEGRLTLQLQFNAAPFVGSIAGALVNTDPGRIQGTLSARGSATGDFLIEIVSRSP